MNEMRLTCYSCEADLRVTLDEVERGCWDVIEVEELARGYEACGHGHADGYAWMQPQILEAMQARAEAAYDREMDSRMDRERERREDWERFEPEPAPDPRDAYDWDDPKRSLL